MKVITVGRSSDNDIVINDIKVSRSHLQLVLGDDGSCCVMDLSSTNGTFVNGVQISRETRLHPNDEIRIGDTILPWQVYINANPSPKNPVSEPVVSPLAPRQPTGMSHNPRNSNRICWYIVIGCVVLLLGGGSVALKIYSDREEQMITRERAEREVDDIIKDNKVAYSEEKAKKAMENAKVAEKARNRAVEEKNAAERAKDAAMVKQKAAEKAKNKAEKQAIRAENDKKQAITEKDNAIKKQKAAEIAKNKAIEKQKIAEDASRDMENELKESRQAAEQLLNKLFTTYASTLKLKDWAEIAKELKLSDIQTSEAKGKVEQEFNKKNYAGKKRIIDLIETVKNRSVNENNKHLEQQ